jgi:hypothetical protein
LYNTFNIIPFSAYMFSKFARYWIFWAIMMVCFMLTHSAFRDFAYCYGGIQWLQTTLFLIMQ